MRFVWFWTFWHWSKEGFRGGSLLHGPLRGIGGHWDEWYRHEASQEDYRAIHQVGQTEIGQRQFIAWLCRHWAGEAGWGLNRGVRRFVLRQLAHLPPFNSWPPFEKYRNGHRRGGPMAIVLAEKSIGEPGDIRTVEAIVLPVESDTEAPSVVPEGFQADESELNTTRSAAMSMLGGKGLLVFLALWTAIGRRPYPRWATIALRLGWLAVGGMIVLLLIGPEPAGHRLVPFIATLAAVWGSLIVTSVVVTGKQALDAWRQGKQLSALLVKHHLRLRLDGGLTVKGGSAGLAFCLNILFSLHGVGLREWRRSWLWRRFFQARSEGRRWAATGVITADSRVRPVVLEPKLRACLRHVGIEHLLTPRQPDAGRRFMNRIAGSLATVSGERPPAIPFAARQRLGFAAEKPRLASHPSSHVAHAVLALGGLTSRWQSLVNVFAVAVSAVILLALPDLQCILFPPPAPAVVGPSSPSPYHLWVTLDTRHPYSFQVVLESAYWSNRRAEVIPYKSVSPSMRAEIRLHRQARPATYDEEDGIVWVERRNWFLNREFAPGERVGRYSLSYLTQLGHE